MNARTRCIRRLVAVTVLLACTLPAAAGWQEEQRVDKKIGLLDHPWRVNKGRLRSRDYLRLRAQVRTGLQSYDQQVERAQEPRGLGSPEMPLPPPVQQPTPRRKPKPRLDPVPVRPPTGGPNDPATGGPNDPATGGPNDPNTGGPGIPGVIPATVVQSPG
jgi:hypothetical protein